VWIDRDLDAGSVNAIGKRDRKDGRAVASSGEKRRIRLAQFSHSHSNSFDEAPCSLGKAVLLFPSASESVRDRHSQEQSGCGGETEEAASAQRPRGLFVSPGKKARKKFEKSYRTPLTGS
jgi:hypothetical protein